MSTFWDTALFVMEKENISRAEVARFLNKDKSIISQWIKFDRIPTADYALQIAKLLNVDIKYLVTGINPEADPLVQYVKNE